MEMSQYELVSTEPTTDLDPPKTLCIGIIQFEYIIVKIFK